MSLYSGTVRFEEYELSISTNYKYAYKAFIKAERGGVSQAVTALAWMYEEGEYVDESLYVAAALYLRASYEKMEDAIEWIQSFFIDNLNWQSKTNYKYILLSDIVKRPYSRVVLEILNINSLLEYRKLRIKEIIEIKEIKRAFILEFLIEIKQYVDCNCNNYLKALSVPEDLFQNSIASGNYTEIEQYLKAVDYIKPGNLDYKIWFEWNEDLIEFSKTAEIGSIIILIDCYNYGFGKDQNTVEALRMFASSKKDYSVIKSDFLIEMAVRLVYRIKAGDSIISINEDSTAAADIILSEVILRDDDFKETAKYIKDLLKIISVEKEETAEKVFFRVSDMYKNDPEKNYYWLWMVSIIHNEDSEIKKYCFERFLQYFYYSSNQDAIECCIKCLQNGDDVSEVIIRLSDNYGAKYLKPMTLLSKNSEFVK